MATKAPANHPRWGFRASPSTSKEKTILNYIFAIIVIGMLIGLFALSERE